MSVGNPSAFPHDCSRVSGMSLRDWFAGQALSGIAGMCDGAGMPSCLVSDAVERAHEYADAMLSARGEDK
jgi:hypothetical protein